MKQAAWLLLCLLPFLVTTKVVTQEPSPGTSSQSEPFPLYKYTLPNGLRVWLQPRPDSESVAALLVINAGSRYETLSNNGVSHYVEHMVFTGSERWSEADQLGLPGRLPAGDLAEEGAPGSLRPGPAHLPGF